jgi:hypothetical protein
MKTSTAKGVFFVLLLMSTFAYGEGSKIPQNYSMSQFGVNFTHTKEIEFVLIQKGKTVPVFVETERFSFNLSQQSFCKAIAINIFGNASHPGGNRNHLLNERNDGYGFTCYQNKEKTDYYFFNTLTNSQYGLSVALGAARGFTIFDLKGLRLDAGIAGTLLSYEKRDRKVLYGALPVPYIKVTYELPRSLGYVSLTQSYLGKGITLRSAEMLQIKLEKLF